MSGHYIIKCRICEDTISSCRCIDPNKTVKYDICTKCKEADSGSTWDGQVTKKRITVVRWDGMTNFDGEHFAVGIIDNMGHGCQVDEHVNEEALMEQCYIITNALKKIEEIQRLK